MDDKLREIFEIEQSFLQVEEEARQRALGDAETKGAQTERARIRQLVLTHAEKWAADGSEFAAQALRELADELGER